jgi:hypothetical protein
LPSSSGWMRLRAGLVLLCAAQVACLETPDYTGRSCDPLNPCPSGYECGSNGTCSAGGAIFPDAAALDALDPAQDARPPGDALSFDSETTDSSEDAGVADLGPADTGIPPDGGDVVRERCANPTGSPAIGWEARYFTLGSQNQLDTCLGVEDFMGDAITRDYGNGGPLEGVTDRFGARYTARRTFPQGVLTLLMSHDDGLRVLIDGATVYERWSDGVQLDVIARTPYLTAGPHDITVEHYENNGFSQIRFAFEEGCTRLDAPTGGWTVGYYRVDENRIIDPLDCFGVEYVPGAAITQSWGASAPAPVLAAGVTDRFAAVARGRRSIGGMTRFSMSHDDGLRVSVAGTRIYDGWTTGTRSNQQVDIYTVGVSEIVVEMHDLAGDASYSVAWTNVCAIQTAPSATSWRARYYPAVQAGSSWNLDRSICLGAETISGEQLLFDWMGGAAGPPQFLGIVEMWGAEYTGPRSFAQQTTINVYTDDGLRVYSGGTLLFDEWRAPQVLNTQLLITPGMHDLRLEYFEWQGGAGLHFTW